MMDSIELAVVFQVRPTKKLGRWKLFIKIDNNWYVEEWYYRDFKSNYEGVSILNGYRFKSEAHKDISKYVYPGKVIILNIRSDRIKIKMEGWLDDKEVLVSSNRYYVMSVCDGNIDNTIHLEEDIVKWYVENQYDVLFSGILKPKIFIAYHSLEYQERMDEIDDQISADSPRLRYK